MSLSSASPSCVAQLDDETQPCVYVVHGALEHVWTRARAFYAPLTLFHVSRAVPEMCMQHYYFSVWYALRAIH